MDRTAIRAGEATVRGAEAGGSTRTPPIERRTLHDEVASRVRDMIIEGVLPPGARMNEVHLGAELGVSRTPLREAIRTLASEGLIELVPSRGAVVRKLTLDDVYGMLEVLAHLEGLAGRLACERASDAEIAEIAVMHRDMMQHYRAAERLPYYKLNQAIHTAIVALTRNRTLQDVHANIQSRLKRIRFIGNDEPAKWRDAADEHEQIIAALAARESDALTKVLERHLWNTWTRVKENL